MLALETSTEVRSLLLAGNKVDAIRVLRRATGDDLKTSFEQVEALIAADPVLVDLFAKRSATQRGRLVRLFAVAIGLVVLAAWIAFRPG